jgi:uncharacterized membrane protein
LCCSLDLFSQEPAVPHSFAAPSVYRILALGATAVFAQACLGQTFTIVPVLPGGTTGNNAAFIAGFGQYVVGDSDSSNTFGGTLEEGYRYDVAGQAATAMGALNPAAFSSHATGICADGAISVGHSVQSVTVGATTGNRSRAFLWYGAGTPFTIGVSGAPAGNLGTSFAYGISGDGGTVFGSSTTATSAVGLAYRWNGGTGFTMLPPLPGTGASSARACSYNASTIVGDSSDVPFRWTNTGGAGTTTPIPPISGAPDGFGLAWGVNTGGTVVVGAITSPTLTDSSLGFAIPQAVAFRWSAAGTRSLGALPSSGFQTSEAFGVSGDGTIIVGDSQTSGTLAAGGITEAFVWTPRWGMSRLADRLDGLVPVGVRLDTATGITYDGRTICGTGTTIATGATFAYVAAIAYCPADQDENGRLEVQDIFQFINDWLAGLPKADADASGMLEVQDIFEFLNRWFAGC